MLYGWRPRNTVSHAPTTAAANTTISSGRHGSSNDVDNRQARLKNTAPAANMHTAWASASLTAYRSPTAGARIGSKSATVSATTSSSARPAAARTASSWFRDTGSDNVNNA